MDHRAFMQAVKAGQIGGAYLFEGPEEHIKDAALKALRKAVLPEGLEEMNEAQLERPAADEVIAASETLPFLGEKRLVIVREQTGLASRGDCEEKLVDYIQHVPESTVLIFFQRGKADARKKLYTSIKKHGQIVSFDQLSEGELNQWIIRRFRDLGKFCEPQVASLLSFTAGSDTALLGAEIEKLAAHSGEFETIEEADVRKLATRSIEYTVFAMVDAVVEGKEGRAFSLMRDMLTAGEERLGILAMLLRQYRLLQHVKIMQYEKKSVPEIKKLLGVPSFAADKCIQQARAYTGGQVRRAVEICIDTETGVKSGKLNQEGALEAAMLRIFALRRPQ